MNVRPQYSQCSFVQYMLIRAVYAILCSIYTCTLIHLYTCTLVHYTLGQFYTPGQCSLVHQIPSASTPRPGGGGYAILAMGKLMPDFRSLGKLFPSYHRFFFFGH